MAPFSGVGKVGREASKAFWADFCLKHQDKVRNLKQRLFCSSPWEVAASYNSTYLLVSSSGRSQRRPNHRFKVANRDGRESICPGGHSNHPNYTQILEPPPSTVPWGRQRVKERSASEQMNIILVRTIIRDPLNHCFEQG